MKGARRLSTIEIKRESGFFCNYCDSCNNSSYAFNFFFSRESVNALVFVLRVVFFQVIMYVVSKRGTCTMLGVGILHYQQVLFQN